MINNLFCSGNIINEIKQKCQKFPDFSDESLENLLLKVMPEEDVKTIDSVYATIILDFTSNVINEKTRYKLDDLNYQLLLCEQNKAQKKILDVIIENNKVKTLKFIPLKIQYDNYFTLKNARVITFNIEFDSINETIKYLKNCNYV